MGNALRRLVSKLPDTWQALLTIAGAFGVGGAVALILVGWVGIPATVEGHGDAIVSLTEDVAANNRTDSQQTADIGWLVCVKGAELGGLDPIAKCGLR